MNKKIIVVVLLVLVIGVAGYFVKNLKKETGPEKVTDQVVTNATTSPITSVEEKPVASTTQTATKTASPKPATKTVVKETSDIILFYGEGCPHCALVRKFLSDNNVSANLDFEMKEVYSSEQNANEMIQKSRLCGMSSNSLAVPFLWDGSRCIIGDVDVINFFKSKIGQ